LEELEYYVPMVSVTSDNWEDLQMRGTAHRFRCDLEHFVFWSKLPQVPLAQIHLFTGVRYTSANEMSCARSSEPLQTVLATFPKAERYSEDDREPRPVTDTWKADLLRRHPWMKGHFEEEDAARRSGIGGPASDSDNHHRRTVAEASEDLTDEQFDDCFNELEARRHLLRVEVVAVKDFKVRVLGGAWCLANLGVPYDAFQGFVSESSPAGAWAVLYHVGKTARFGVQLFGDAIASVMANEWANRCQYFWNIHQGQELPLYVYTAAEIAAYTPLDAFTEVLRVFGPLVAGHQRLLDLSNLVPRLH
jgi:hypothetical protein